MEVGVYLRNIQDDKERKGRQEKCDRLKTERIADFELSINARLNENISLQAKRQRERVCVIHLSVIRCLWPPETELLIR
jgi:hypothetical protein